MMNFWLFIHSALAVSDWLTDNLNLTDPANYVGESCLFSLALDSGKTCAKRCQRSCGLTPASPDWTTRRSRYCSRATATCTTPQGVRTIVPIATQQSDLWQYGILANAFNGFTHDGVLTKDDASVFRVARKILTPSPQGLAHLINPYRLAYSSISTSKRAAARQQCSYVHLAVPLHPKILQSIGTASTQTQDINGGEVFLHAPSRGFLFGPCSSPSAMNNTLYGYAADSYEVPGRYVAFPSINPLLQQWFLSGSGPESLNVALTRSYEAMAAFDSKEVVVVATDENSDIKTDRLSDSLYELETFTTLNWDTSTSPECADRKDCAACTVNGRCSWCDLSSASTSDLSQTLGWHSNAGSVTADGSACGVPPLACALMGGIPASTSTCRVLI